MVNGSRISPDNLTLHDFVLCSVLIVLESLILNKLIISFYLMLPKYCAIERILLIFTNLNVPASYATRKEPIWIGIKL